MKIKHFGFIFAFFITMTLNVHAGQPVYEIRSAEFFSEGRTLPYFLELAAEIEIGKQFSSSSGLLLSGRARDYNFLGTMEPLRINLNWELDMDSNISWGADASFIYPFSAFQYDWIWNLDTVLTISDTGTDYSLGTGITMHIPTKFGKVAIFGDQGVNVNGRGTYYAVNGDAVYFTESTGASISVPLYTIHLL